MRRLVISIILLSFVILGCVPKSDKLGEEAISIIEKQDIIGKKIEVNVSKTIEEEEPVHTSIEESISIPIENKCDLADIFICKSYKFGKDKLYFELENGKRRLQWWAIEIPECNYVLERKVSLDANEPMGRFIVENCGPNEIGRGISKEIKVRYSVGDGWEEEKGQISQSNLEEFCEITYWNSEQLRQNVPIINCEYITSKQDRVVLTLKNVGERTAKDLEVHFGKCSSNKLNMGQEETKVITIPCSQEEVEVFYIDGFFDAWGIVRFFYINTDISDSPIQVNDRITVLSKIE